jgi:hypothetical protein
VSLQGCTCPSFSFSVIVMYAAIYQIDTVLSSVGIPFYPSTYPHMVYSSFPIS